MIYLPPSPRVKSTAEPSNLVQFQHVSAELRCSPGCVVWLCQGALESGPPGIFLRPGILSPVEGHCIVWLRNSPRTCGLDAKLAVLLGHGGPWWTVVGQDRMLLLRSLVWKFQPHSLQSFASLGHMWSLRLVALHWMPDTNEAFNFL